MDESGRDGAKPGIGLPVAKAALVVAGLLVVASAWRALPVAEWVDRAAGPIREAGPAGVAIYGAIYVVGVVLMVPGTAMTLAGAYLYGPVIGTLVVSAAATAGAGCAFLVARTFLRDRVRLWAGADRRFAAIDRAIAERGARVVFLLRLTPLVPFNVLNYALGATGVRFGPYLLASWAGMLPGTIVVVLIGSRLGGRDAGLGPWGWAAAVLATVVATVYVGRLATRALGEADDCGLRIADCGLEDGGKGDAGPGGAS